MVENKVLNQIMLELKSINCKIDNLERTTVKKEDFEKVVGNLATKEEISKLATKEEISMLATKEEMHELFNQNRKEMYALVDKTTKEIATVINELSESISKTMNKNYNELKQQLEINNKEHRIYEAQIAKLQLTTEYLSKGKALA